MSQLDFSVSGPALKKRRIVKSAPKSRTKKLWTSGTIGKPMPFPTRMVAKLRYCETVAIQTAVTNQGAVFYSCNSIYDPYKSGAGHQPYGHDTYSTIYNHYTVLKSKCKFQMTQSSAVLQANTYGGTIEDDTSPASLSFDAWRERPNCKEHMLVINAGAEQRPLTLYWDRNKRFPKQDTYLALSAPFGADPAEQEYFMLVAQSASVGLSLGTVYVSVEIEYTCEFYELKDLGSS